MLLTAEREDALFDYYEENWLLSAGVNARNDCTFARARDKNR